jgi:alkylhydroperoxidase/carboxymuconolactone decarboxylase family protein YurZ
LKRVGKPLAASVKKRVVVLMFEYGLVRTARGGLRPQTQRLGTLAIAAAMPAWRICLDTTRRL